MAGYTTERVEVRPGVFIKMSPDDKKAWLATQPQAAPAAAERATAEAPEKAVLPAPKPRKGR